MACQSVTMLPNNQIQLSPWTEAIGRTRSIKQLMRGAFAQRRLHPDSYRKLMACLVWWLPFTFIGCWSEPKSSPPRVPEIPQPKADFSVTRPASPSMDYVGSQVCASCHRKISEAYASHPMANSLSRIENASPIENYADRTEFAPPGNR